MLNFNIQKCIEIIKSEKDKYGFCTLFHSDGKDRRCTIGLLLSHYGWDGISDNIYNSTDRVMYRGGSYWEKLYEELGQIPSADIKDYYLYQSLARINDESSSFDEVIEKLSNPEIQKQLLSR